MTCIHSMQHAFVFGYAHKTLLRGSFTLWPYLQLRKNRRHALYSQQMMALAKVDAEYFTQDHRLVKHCLYLQHAFNGDHATIVNLHLLCYRISDFSVLCLI